MPADLPFLAEKKESLEETPTWIPTPYEERVMKEDREEVSQMALYRQKFIPQWNRGARVLNLIADPVVDDRVSNVFIGLARMLIDTAHSAMTDGAPAFGFRPGAPHDYAKTDLWKAMMQNVLSDCNFEEHQSDFFINYFGLGPAAYEVFTQTPFRTIREENGDGEFTERVIRDYRRPRLGVRSRSPHEIFINPNSRLSSEIPSCAFQDNFSYDQFVQNFARVFLPNGKPKYKNTEFVSLGKSVEFGITGKLRYRLNERSSVEVLTYQNELKDVQRIYANGVLIFDKCLRHDRNAKIPSGANPLGMTTLCIGRNNYQFDQNLQTQSLYGMSDVHLVKGLDALYQAFFNMTVDNWKLANSVVISYKPYGNSTLDLDNMDFYSGTMVDGEVVTSQLGKVNLSEYNELRQGIEDLCIWLTGTNYKQLVGETSKTAFELSQRIRAQNKRFESKVRQLESGCYKKLGRLLLSNCMADLTVEDFEKASDLDIDNIKQALSEGKKTKEDYVYDDGNIVGRKVRYMIRIPGKAYREDFSKSKKRKLDHNSAENTLVLDKKKMGQDSFIPAVGEYIWSQEFIEHGGIPDVYVEGDTMVTDKKTMQAAEIGEFLPLAMQIKQMELQTKDESFKTNVDFGELVKQYGRAKDLPESVFGKASGQDSSQKIKDLIEQLKASSSLPPNAQSPQMAGQVSGPSFAGAPPMGASPTPSNPSGPSPDRAANPLAQVALGRAA